MSDAKRLAYRIDEAAELAGLSRRTIYELITTGKLKTVKVRRCRLIPAASLNTLLEKGAGYGTHLP